MCWCTPEIRTPNCGKMGCHPPSRYSEGFQDGLKSAIKEIQGWRSLAKNENFLRYCLRSLHCCRFSFLHVWRCAKGHFVCSPRNFYKG